MVSFFLFLYNIRRRLSPLGLSGRRGESAGRRSEHRRVAPWRRECRTRNAGIATLEPRSGRSARHATAATDGGPNLARDWAVDVRRTETRRDLRTRLGGRRRRLLYPRRGGAIQTGGGGFGGIGVALSETASIAREFVVFVDPIAARRLLRRKDIPSREDGGGGVDRDRRAARQRGRSRQEGIRACGGRRRVWLQR